MNEMGQWQTRDSFMSLLRKNGIQIRIRFLIFPMAEGFIARHIEIGGRKHTENRMIIRGLDMTARGTHDGKISGKCIHSRPFSLSKSGVRAYSAYRGMYRNLPMPPKYLLPNVLSSGIKITS
jgi:hypothetical protein